MIAVNWRSIVFPLTAWIFGERRSPRSLPSPPLPRFCSQFVCQAARDRHGIRTLEPRGRGREEGGGEGKGRPIDRSRRSLYQGDVNPGGIFRMGPGPGLYMPKRHRARNTLREAAKCQPASTVSANLPTMCGHVRRRRSCGVFVRRTNHSGGAINRAFMARVLQ